MPVRSDKPLRRVNINLYEEDCKFMEKEHGRGWTQRVRQLLHQDCKKRQRDKSLADTLKR